VPNNFVPPKPVDRPKINHKVIGVEEGSSERQVLFESTDYEEFEKAYRHYYSEGKYTAVFKEFNDTSGGIL
tara:strand:+ start:876 stop:1088 length:213 start_codon:yes stop_codon:yes gene_type:complete